MFHKACFMKHVSLQLLSIMTTCLRSIGGGGEKHRHENILQSDAHALALLFKCLSEILFLDVKRLIEAAAVVTRTLRAFLLIGSSPSL